MDLTASWTPLQRWTFLVNLPLQVRERQDVALATERGFGPGEIDLAARFLLVGAGGFRPRHLVSLVATARLPTRFSRKPRKLRWLSTSTRTTSGEICSVIALP